MTVKKKPIANPHKWLHRIILISGATCIISLCALITVYYLRQLHTFPLPQTVQNRQAVLAVDSANIITDPEWFIKAHQDCVDLYIIHSTIWGTCTAWDRTQPQLKMALAAGMKIAAYTRDPTCWQGGLAATGPYQKDLAFFALDIETNPGIPATSQMVTGIQAAGVQPVIYTGADMWPSIEGSHANDFKTIPLWDTNATYQKPQTLHANLSLPQAQVYGGWNMAGTMRIGIQQYFEYNLNGIAVDISSFDQSFVTSH
jgi:hypothetical protein